MEYVREETDLFKKLPFPNVDHGSGLERFAAAANNDNDIFNLDVFQMAIREVEQLGGEKYNPVLDDTEILGVDRKTIAFRVIADHLRGATFFIADGVYPANKDQGYFVRRLLRRAIRSGKALGIETNFCSKIAKIYINYFAETYNELKENEHKVYEIIDEEENRFRKTLENGIKEFLKSKFFTDLNFINTHIDSLYFSGGLAFDYYQTCGFPLDAMIDILKENKIKLNYEQLIEGFNYSKDLHAKNSRAGSEEKFKGGLKDHSDIVVKYHTATHLLHQALREVLGETVYQKGSNLTPERLRFDFSFDRKMTDEEKRLTEEKVNAWIKTDYPVRFENITQDEAKKRGAIGLFGEKYGDIVKVYTIGNSTDRGADTPSIEFCGGPHVERTGVIGEFKIIKEEAVSQGVRRIKAVVK